MKQIEYLFITEVNNDEKMRKTLNKYMTVLHYADKNLILLSGADSGISLFFYLLLFVVDTLVRKTSASIRLVFLIGNAIVKLLLETKRKEKNKHRWVILLAKSKLNSIEKVISKALIDSDVSNDEIILMISGEQNFQTERKDQSIRRPAG